MKVEFYSTRINFKLNTTFYLKDKEWNKAKNEIVNENTKIID